MKTLRRYNNLLLATCSLCAALVIATYMAPAHGNSSWKRIEGAHVSEDGFQLKCGEGSGWQKCGESAPQEDQIGVKVCKHDASHRVVMNNPSQCMIKTSRCNGGVTWEGSRVISAALTYYFYVNAAGEHSRVAGNYKYEKYDAGRNSGGGVCRTRVK